MATTNDAAVSLLAGALFGLIAAHYYRYHKVESFEEDEEEEDDDEEDEDEAVDEGFEDGDGEEEGEGEGEGFVENFEEEEGEEEGDGEGFVENFEEEEGEEDFVNEGFADVDTKEETKEETTEKKPVAKKIPPPDNGDRSEFFNLGKKYKLPSESDDKEFHLDAGTTFLNAYKSLKPDQIAAMTKDTQDLMQTQKQLMSTLATLKPLITDGKDMMDMFKSYFGNGDNTTN
jgi:cobalamin biosynthesis protein CobT